MFEKSKWITKAWDIDVAGSRNHPLPLLRKSFDAKAGVKSAVVHICGLGFGVYYLNGERITEDVLTTPYTKYDSTILYQTYDVTDKISEKNIISVSLGNGMYNNESEIWHFEKASWRAQPKLICELVIEYENGEVQKVVTDSTWKAADGPVVFSQVRSGEIYDARREPQGWKTVGFDDLEWESAAVCPGGGGALKPIEKLPPIRITETIEPVQVNGDVYDFGVNISGWCLIETDCEAGCEIQLDFSEKIDDSGNIDTENINRGNLNVAPHRDIYITRDGFQTWEPSFIYHAFRYVKVTNASKDFKIYARMVHTDLQTIGSFECSDEMLNKVHNACRRTIVESWHSYPQDCPHREQNGWTADAMLASEASLYNFDMLEAYRKWMRDFKDVQNPNGQIPSIVPTSSYGYNFCWIKYNFGAGPGWDSALIQIPYEIYKLTGDISIIREMWANMKQLIYYMESVADNYIIYYGLGDWLPPADADTCSSGVVDTAYFYSDAVVMSYCAELLGEDSSYFSELAAKIKQAFRTSFVKDGSVAGGGQTAMACGMYRGLLEADEVPQSAQKLYNKVVEKGFHFDCGIHGARDIVPVLSENGYASSVYKMITNPTFPSFAVWMNSGLTTIAESWPMENSHNHPAFAAVDTWFYKYLAGIRVNGGKITINPCIIPELDWVKASYKDVSVEWNRKQLKIKLGCEADLVLNGEIKHLTHGEWVFDI